MVFNLTNFSNSTNSTNSTNVIYTNKKYDNNKILMLSSINSFLFLIFLCIITPILVYCIAFLHDLLYELLTKIYKISVRKKKRNKFIIEMGTMEHRIVGKKNEKG